ncbi:MAG TPA: hypothetical protein VFS40_09470 [Gemmatimonadales bacterium]|nr:hypothetical protein [Gemmatimonadales bacterium]
MKKSSKTPRRRSPAKPASRKRATAPSTDAMRPEYDFSRGTRNKYAARYREGSNIVVLDPDVADAFQDSAAVNHALRTLLELVPPSGPRGRKRRTA